METNTKHTPTPGPWEPGWGDGITGPNAAAMFAWNDKYPIRFSGVFGSAEVVAAVPRSDPRHEANARLIAASPELLEALQSMCSVWQTVCNSRGWVPEHVSQFVQAQAVINKAIGQ